MSTTMRAIQPANSLPPRPETPGLTADALDFLEQFGSTVRVRQGHKIYGAGEPAAFCWKLLSGCARTVKFMADGRRQVAEFLWPGDLLGLDDVGTHYFAAEAVTDTMLRRYPRSAVEAQANRHPDLALRLRSLALANLRRAHQQIILLGRETAKERVVSFLLDMDDHAVTAEGRLMVLPMSRTDIADYLGLSIETVCRHLVRLQREGILAIRRTGIELLDRAALREITS